MGINLFSDKILQAICWTLLHSLWQALILAAITAFIMIVTKKSSSNLRYTLLSCIFILFLITVGFTFNRQWHLADENKMELTIAGNTSFNQHDLSISPGKNIQPINILQNYLSVFFNYFNTHASLIVTIWFIVFMAKCVRIFAGLVHVQRIRHYRVSDAPEFWKEKIIELANKLGIQKPILLLESAIVKVPVVVGILKPAILVPFGLLTNLPPHEVEAILIHELAHIRRRDYFFNLLQCFVDIIFFFNPAILWISSLIRNERENCCDDIAIHQTKNKKQFIQALVSFHQYNLSASKYAMPFADNKNRLLNRVQRIINNNSNHTLNSAEKIALVVSLFVFSVVFISITKGQSAPPKKQAAQNKSDVIKTDQSSQKTNKAKPSPNPERKKITNPKKINEPATTPAPDIETEAELQTDHDDFKTLGYTDISADQLDKLRDHGVTAEFIKELYQSGYRDISLEKALQLKDHGVSPEFINSFKEMGFKDISLDKAQELRDHGVSTGFIKDFREIGFNNISLEKAQQLRDHGVDAGFIKAFYQMNYKDISLQKAIELRNHGVNASFINDFREAGFNDISLDKAQQLRDHGVNLDFINEFRNSGFKTISLDKAIQLRDHGVTIGFIEKMKEKMGSADLSLDEYIILKDRF